MQNNPCCIGGDNFYEQVRQLNRNKSFEAGAKWADSNPKITQINVENDLSNVYVVSHLEICEHNMGTFRILSAPKVCWSLEEAQEEMKAMAKKDLANLGYEMNGDSEEAILNRNRFEKVFTMLVFEETNGMKFDVLWFPHPNIEELWESNRFIIEILPSEIELK